MATAVLLGALPLGVLGSSSSDYSPLAFLLNLRGEPVSVRYAPGSLDRAAHLQQRFELVASDCRSWTRVPLTLLVYVLGFEEWQAAGIDRPYGLPQHLSSQELAVASWGDAQTVELWRGLLGRRLPAIPGTALRGSPEEVASMALHDLMAVVEASRMCLMESGVTGDQPWIEGILVQTMALSFIQKHETGRLEEVDRIFASLSEAGGGAGSHPLSTALDPDSGAAWIWAEAQYYQAAKLIAEEEGKSPAKVVLKLAAKRDGHLEAAELVSRYPALATWLQRAFAVPPSTPEQ